MDMKMDAFLVDIIQEAAEKALNKLFHEHHEKFYYCSLILHPVDICCGKNGIAIVHRGLCPAEGE